MTNPIRVGVQLWPGGTPDYQTWREAVLTAEQLGADAIFGYDHFHKPSTERAVRGRPAAADARAARREQLRRLDRARVVG